jgi:uncharacterized membrane-anchored protein
LRNFFRYNPIVDQVSYNESPLSSARRGEIVVGSKDLATVGRTTYQGRALAWLVAAFMALAAISTARADAFSNGLSAYNVGDYAGAYALWLPLAK